MRLAPFLVAIAVGGLGVARSARLELTSERTDEDPPPPYTPSPEAAPFVALGYREAAADILFVRLRGYFGAYYGTTASAVASLGEAIVALDPQFHRAYEYSANAMTVAPGVDQSVYERSVALLERGVSAFPKDWSLPMLAGLTYIQDLKTDDEAKRRQWDERGVLLVESAIRKPGAPQRLGVWAAFIRTRLGQRERAAEGLRELLLTTTDQNLRKELLERLAKIEEVDADEIAAEVFEARKKFEGAWRANRPYVNASMYVILGDPRPAGFDLTELATGGRDLVMSETFEPLEPLE